MPIKLEERDKAMILDESRWPIWPVLPMKHRTRREPGGFTVTGIMTTGEPTKILVGTLGITDWKTAPVEEFATVDELLANGWIVD